MTRELRVVPDDDVIPAPNDVTSAELAHLLRDFGGDDWDIVWLEDGRLGARPRNGNPRPAGPFVLVAGSPAQMRNLLESASSPKPSLRHSHAFPSGSISETIIFRLRESGLDVRELARSGRTVDFLVTNPQRPEQGYVVINRNGLIEWNHHHQATDEIVIAHMTNAVISLLVLPPDRVPDRSGPPGSSAL